MDGFLENNRPCTSDVSHRQGCAASIRAPSKTMIRECVSLQSGPETYMIARPSDAYVNLPPAVDVDTVEDAKAILARWEAWNLRLQQQLEMDPPFSSVCSDGGSAGPQSIAPRSRDTLYNTYTQRMEENLPSAPLAATLPPFRVAYCTTAATERRKICPHSTRRSRALLLKRALGLEGKPLGRTGWTEEPEERSREEGHVPAMGIMRSPSVGVDSRGGEGSDGGRRDGNYDADIRERRDNDRDDESAVQSCRTLSVAARLRQQLYATESMGALSATPPCTPRHHSCSDRSNSAWPRPPIRSLRAFSECEAERQENVLVHILSSCFPEVVDEALLESRALLAAIAEEEKEGEHESKTLRQGCEAGARIIDNMTELPACHVQLTEPEATAPLGEREQSAAYYSDDSEANKEEITSERIRVRKNGDEKEEETREGTKEEEEEAIIETESEREEEEEIEIEEEEVKEKGEREGDIAEREEGGEEEIEEEEEKEQSEREEEEEAIIETKEEIKEEEEEKEQSEREEEEEEKEQSEREEEEEEITKTEEEIKEEEEEKEQSEREEEIKEEEEKEQSEREEEEEVKEKGEREGDIAEREEGGEEEIEEEEEKEQSEREEEEEEKEQSEREEEEEEITKTEEEIKEEEEEKEQSEREEEIKEEEEKEQSEREEEEEMEQSEREEEEEEKEQSEREEEEEEITKTEEEIKEEEEEMEQSEREEEIKEEEEKEQSEREEEEEEKEQSEREEEEEEITKTEEEIKEEEEEKEQSEREEEEEEMEQSEREEEEEETDELERATETGRSDRSSYQVSMNEIIPKETYIIQVLTDCAVDIQPTDCMTCVEQKEREKNKDHKPIDSPASMRSLTNYCFGVDSADEINDPKDKEDTAAAEVMSRDIAPDALNDLKWHPNENNKTYSNDMERSTLPPPATAAESFIDPHKVCETLQEAMNATQVLLDEEYTDRLRVLFDECTARDELWHFQYFFERSRASSAALREMQNNTHTAQITECLQRALEDAQSSARSRSEALESAHHALDAHLLEASAERAAFAARESSLRAALDAHTATLSATQRESRATAARALSDRRAALSALAGALGARHAAEAGRVAAGARSALLAAELSAAQHRAARLRAQREALAGAAVRRGEKERTAVGLARWILYSVRRRQQVEIRQLRREAVERRRELTMWKNHVCLEHTLGGSRGSVGLSLSCAPRSVESRLAYERDEMREALRKSVAAHGELLEELVVLRSRTGQ